MCATYSIAHSLKRFLYNSFNQVTWFGRHLKLKAKKIFNKNSFRLPTLSNTINNIQRQAKRRSSSIMSTASRRSNMPLMPFLSFSQLLTELIFIFSKISFNFQCLCCCWFFFQCLCSLLCQCLFWLLFFCLPFFFWDHIKTI